LAFLENFILLLINTVINEAAQHNQSIFDNPSDDNRVAFLDLFDQKVVALTETFLHTDVCNDFNDYTFDGFLQYSNTTFERILNDRFTINGFVLSPELVNKVKVLVYTILKVKEENSVYTGLIFTGFGEDEIYPQLIPINISMVVDNRLRYFVNENRIASISNYNNGAVCPFAQTDVINKILSGIDPSLNDVYHNNFGALFEKYNREILTILGDNDPEMSAQIQALDTRKLVFEYAQMNQQITRLNYIAPLMNAVSSLSKEDLAEMAESLIYLTYLKRRITNAEESVGGPVDVAIISKGDGFIWIKRKHYFKPELNQFYFDNYHKL